MRRVSRLLGGASIVASFGLGCSTSADDSGADSVVTVQSNALQERSVIDATSDLEAPAQPFDVVYGQLVVNAEPVANLAPQASVVEVNTAWEQEHKAPQEAPAIQPKVAAELAGTVAAMIARGEGGQSIDVMVLLRETVKVPRFPSLRPDQSRNSPENARALGVADAIVERLRAARAPEHAQMATELGRLGGELRESHWLVNAISAKLPARAISTLADRDDVVRLAPVVSGSVGVNQLVDSRALLNTDPYFNIAGMNTGFLGVIDSGVRSSHTLVSPRLSFVRDCVNGTSNNCNTGSNLNPSDAVNHGTGVMSVISGSTNLGAANRGVTGITLDSFKVTTSGGGIDGNALIRAYAAAVAVGDDVITASILRWEDENDFVAAGADNAFNAGRVIIACQGNEGPTTYQARSPGNARKALAVGMVDVTTQALENGSSRGPSNDGRIKPDLVGPTNIDAASNASNNALARFGGCSFATPHVAGAAALYRNWVRGSIPNVEPGQVYALMLAAGNNPAFNSSLGAGLPTLLVNGGWHGGKFSVTHGADVDVPISVTGTVSRLDVAIWWPESIGGSHNDIDVSLINPSGTVVASSTMVLSVFEKLRFSTATIGNWKIRIRGFNVVGTQSVYLGVYKWN